MYRSVAVRAAQLSGRRLQSTVAVPAGTRVEQTFVDLPQDEQRKTILQLNEVMKQDWTKITMEDKRALYFVAYGPHNARRPHVKPGDNMKVFVGVVATIALGLGLSSFVRSSVPKSRTLTKEWQEDSNRIARENNINPISGVSSEGYKGKGFVQSN
ncbi:cytochrome c oxidase [Coemansia sp. RSA 2322]|uniref:Cytochrome c oxidase n=1 Tax=Coemansia thaxteri TaxID=2663907 RepID=A0A9W8BIL3_9FUNG|nr:cytochrome c oxidase [Coemansia thaxteri]KAJ2460268.1 cytochrome c oxidase [Coemansia sp. RSA 2322]KAJ2487075.1 cytochrome c oxidase [Coemansia sp. RSA 2320]